MDRGRSGIAHDVLHLLVGVGATMTEKKPTLESRNTKQEADASEAHRCSRGRRGHRGWFCRASDAPARLHRRCRSSPVVPTTAIPQLSHFSPAIERNGKLRHYPSVPPSPHVDLGSVAVYNGRASGTSTPGGERAGRCRAGHLGTWVQGCSALRPPLPASDFRLAVNPSPPSSFIPPPRRKASFARISAGFSSGALPRSCRP